MAVIKKEPYQSPQKKSSTKTGQSTLTIILVLMIVLLFGILIGGFVGYSISKATKQAVIPQEQPGPMAQLTAIPSPLPTTIAVKPSAFQPGGISFLGVIKSNNNNVLLLTMPNGQPFTAKIVTQTDLTGFNGTVPPVGTAVDMDSAVRPDNTFVVTMLQPVLKGNNDINVVEYTGYTTSPVGSDQMIHLQVGSQHYSFMANPVPTTNLSDFDGDVHSIRSGTQVKVNVQLNGTTTTVIKVSRVES